MDNDEDLFLFRSSVEDHFFEGVIRDGDSRFLHFETGNTFLIAYLINTLMDTHV